ncbi:hypothetical protein SNEBB_001397 [Seison nebaliae]|nr:hypothetical protein SNEBB_001397 [Seison nebaliae]
MEDICRFYIMRKGRHCQMKCRKNEEFCAEHSSINRIKCPIDGNHTVDINKLEKHLLKCNKGKICNSFLYEKNCNSSQDDDIDGNDKVLLSSFLPDEMDDLMMDLKKLFNLLNVINYEKSLSIDKSESILPVMKESIQIESIIDLMKHENFFQHPSTFVELGCGKGRLSYFINRYLHEMKSSSNFVLIDRKSQRNKFDGKFEKDVGSCQRYCIDLKHCQLKRLENCHSITAIGKHVCGNATDLTLNSLKNVKVKLKGVAIATCCHHQCIWREYVGQEMWCGRMNLTERHFQLAIRCCSWATSHRQEKFRHGSQELQTKDREDIGMLCRQLIDEGRRYFIEKELGLKPALLTSYIPTFVTPENLLLMATV